MKMSEAFPSKYISPTDLQGNPRVLTMNDVEKEIVGKDNDLVPVLYFKEAKKGLCLNRGNILTRKCF